MTTTGISLRRCPCCHGRSRRCPVLIGPDVGLCALPHGHDEHGLARSPHLSEREAAVGYARPEPCNTCDSSGFVELSELEAMTLQRLADDRIVAALRARRLDGLEAQAADRLESTSAYASAMWSLLGPNIYCPTCSADSGEPCTEFVPGSGGPEFEPPAVPLAPGILVHYARIPDSARRPLRTPQPAPDVQRNEP